MAHYQVGIDDFGTATRESEGWSIVSLADAEATTFSAETAALLGGGLAKFHGKDFTRRSESRFRDFLSLVKEKCGGGAGGFVACTLNARSLKEGFLAHAGRVSDETFRTAGVPLGEEELAPLRRVVPPLFTFLRVSAHVGAAHTAEFTLDEDSVTRTFNGRSVSVRGKAVALSRLAGMLYRAYRNQLFPTSPTIVGGEIRTARDETSPIVQAADVVGNFSTAYLFSQPGKRSKANDLKAELFRSVFGDPAVPGGGHSSLVELAGDDLRLREPGAYTLRIA